MANVIEWIDGRDGNVWFVRTDALGYMCTTGSVTYYPDEQKYSALFVPSFALVDAPQQVMKFDSLEEAQAWLMTLARMG